MIDNKLGGDDESQSFLLSHSGHVLDVAMWRIVGKSQGLALLML